MREWCLLITALDALVIWAPYPYDRDAARY
jgi:hypothetical protein